MTRVNISAWTTDITSYKKLHHRIVKLFLMFDIQKETTTTTKTNSKKSYWIRWTVNANLLEYNHEIKFTKTKPTDNKITELSLHIKKNTFYSNRNANTYQTKYIRKMNKHEVTDFLVSYRYFLLYSPVLLNYHHYQLYVDSV